MKKKTILSIIILMMSVMSFANGEPDFIGEQLELEVGYIKDLPIGTSRPRTPETIPTIYFNGSTLFFATPCEDYTLQIVDESENICYDLVIPIGTNELDLPENLFGEYKLRIINGNTCYYGVVTII